MPSATCPIPSAHTPASAHDMYLKKKKEMPGLTPAAWRKAAAQEMGMDYDTYLALWKANKGAKAAAKLVSESTPTVPAAASSSSSMGIKTTHAPKSITQWDVDDAVTESFDDAMDHFSIMDAKGEVKVVQKPSKKSLSAYINEQNLKNLTNDLNEMGFDATLKYGTITVKKVPLKLTGDLGKSVGKADPYSFAAPAPKKAAKKAAAKKTSQSTLAKKESDDVMDAYKSGKASYEDTFAKLGDIAVEADIEDVYNYVDKLGKQLDGLDMVAKGIINTAHGPLTHDLAQNVFKKMKAEMPGATPATLRHAAADYLKVPYNSYLKAWKKPTSGVAKSSVTKAAKLPPNTNTPLSPPKTGKWSKKEVEQFELKQDIVDLYGPGAMIQHINLAYNDMTGVWSYQLSKFLVKTEAHKKAIVKGLKDLGLDVKINGNMISMKSGVAAKTVTKNAVQIAKNGTYTAASGDVVLDIQVADAWTERWWATLNSEERKAWKAYTSATYRQINGNLRRGGTHVYEAPLKRTMQPVEHEFTVYRGLGDEPGRSLTIDTFKPGQKWTDKGFGSSSPDPNKAWRGVRLEIVLPKKTKGMYIGKRSSAPGEGEYLIDSKTTFRVLSVKRDPYSVYKGVVKLVAIPH